MSGATLLCWWTLKRHHQTCRRRRGPGSAGRGEQILQQRSLQVLTHRHPCWVGAPGTRCRPARHVRSDRDAMHVRSDRCQCHASTNNDDVYVGRWSIFWPGRHRWWVLQKWRRQRRGGGEEEAAAALFWDEAWRTSYWFLRRCCLLVQRGTYIYLQRNYDSIDAWAWRISHIVDRMGEAAHCSLRSLVQPAS